MTNKEKREKLSFPLYCVTAREYSKGRSVETVVTAMLNGGAKIIQYREKELSLRRQYEECKTLRKLTENANALFIVNDRVDLAFAVEADGLHIGQEDIPLPKARHILGEGAIIGVSTHAPAQAQRAIKEGADYIGVGPLYETKTKKDVCAPVGTAYLDYAAKNVSIPFVAIGGIKEENILELLSHGARCVALVSAIVGADDIEAITRRLIETIERERTRA